MDPCVRTTLTGKALRYQGVAHKTPYPRCRLGGENVTVTPSETRFRSVSDLVLETLDQRIALDWSVPAGSLEWSCWKTVDHMIDCVFSYAFQVASRAQSGFLPFHELHAMPEAKPSELVTGLRGITELFSGLLGSVPGDVEASDGVFMLDVDDWAVRAAYEMLLHTHDVVVGLGARFDPPSSMCAWVITSPKLWMLDRAIATTIANPWEALLLGSGRTPVA